MGGGLDCFADFACHCSAFWCVKFVRVSGLGQGDFKDFFAFAKALRNFDSLRGEFFDTRAKISCKTIFTIIAMNYINSSSESHSKIRNAGDH